MSAIARFIRNRLAMVYIFRPRTMTRHTTTLPAIPISDKIPLNIKMVVMIMGGIVGCCDVLVVPFVGGNVYVDGVVRVLSLIHI